MTTYAISLGGSIVIQDEINVTYLKKFLSFLNSTVKQGNKVGIIIGGGKTVRKYQTAAKTLAKCTNDDLDMIGIKQVNMHAHWLHTILSKSLKGKLVPKVIFENEKINFGRYDVAIFTAKRTGRTTDYGASVFAKNHDGQVVNLSNIYYVYDKDPKLTGAKPLKSLKWIEYKKIFKTHKAGLHAPFDPVAARFCQKHNLPVIITKGDDITNLKKVLNGKGKFTIIS